MKIGFFGTPDFASAVLSELLRTEGAEVLFAVTKPDAAVGRSGSSKPSPVKAVATAAGIPVFTPGKIASNEAFEAALR